MSTSINFWPGEQYLKCVKWPQHIFLVSILWKWFRILKVITILILFHKLLPVSYFTLDNLFDKKEIGSSLWKWIRIIRKFRILNHFQKVLVVFFISQKLSRILYSVIINPLTARNEVWRWENTPQYVDLFLKEHII